MNIGVLLPPAHVLILSYNYLVFSKNAISDRLYDVCAKTNTMGGLGAKRLIATCRVA